MNDDTPETDEDQFVTGRVSLDFARRLERERNGYKDAIKNCLEYAGGRECEWGERAKEAFLFLKNAIAEPPILNPKIVITNNHGHPWTGEAGWDLMEIEAESEERLSVIIEQARSEFWHIWIRGNTGEIKAILYKPGGASEEWVDLGNSANAKPKP
jgi:hypothetical protein